MNRLLGFHGLFAKNSPALVDAFSREGNTFTPLDLPISPKATASTNLSFLRRLTINWESRYKNSGERLIGVGHSLGALRLLQVINGLTENPFTALILNCPVPPGDIGINLLNWREVKARFKTLGAYLPIIRQCVFSKRGWNRMVARDYETFCKYLLPSRMEEAERREAFSFQRPEFGQVVRNAIFKRPTIDWKKINCPVIIFLGSEDNILSPNLRIGEKMINALRNAHPRIAPDFFAYQTIPNMGHYLRKADAIKIAESALSHLEHFKPEPVSYAM